MGGRRGEGKRVPTEGGGTDGRIRGRTKDPFNQSAKKFS